MTNQDPKNDLRTRRIPPAFLRCGLLMIAMMLMIPLGGCRTEAGTDAGIGAMLGAATGAIIGHNVHGQTAEGAAIGALGGAFGGYIIGNETDKHRMQRGSPNYSY